MQPNKKLIAINDNEQKITQMINELVLQPRINAIKWSDITKQTPNIKIGYPGQHLASLIAGMYGERTGARGNDLSDGSEVKSCSRVDQLDSCKDCKSPVARSEINCPACNSINISRKDDSKWLFSVKNENDLKVLTKDVQRIMLIIGDYPNFSENDFSTLRFQAFEIWTNSPRCKRFVEIMTNYYNKIYLGHKASDANKTPAPKNFWPYSYQFYICNPVNVFSCTVKNADKKPNIIIDNYVKPETDRSKLDSVLMPADLLTEEELEIVMASAKPDELKSYITVDYSIFKGMSYKDRLKNIKGLSEKLRSYLSLRETDKISTAKNAYSRRVA